MATRVNQKKASSPKVGRNIAKCQLYKTRLKRVTNKRKRIAKHIAVHPNDSDAVKSV